MRGRCFQWKCELFLASTVVLLTRSHHVDMYPRPYNDGKDRDDTIIWRAREAEEPLTGMSRRAELGGAPRGSPDVLPATRRREVHVNGVVVARPDNADRTAERKRQHRSWRKESGNTYNGNRFSHMLSISVR